MIEKPTPSFYDELLSYLQKELLQKRREEGWENDQQAIEYGEEISRAIRSAGGSLDGIIERHHYLFGERGPLHLEQKLLAAFPDSVLEKYQRKPIRIYRGLPRLYKKTEFGVSKIKPPFSSLPTLKAHLAWRYLSESYSRYPLTGKISLLCWVMPDGWGDFFAAVEAARVIQSESLQKLTLFVISEKSCPEVKDLLVSRWEGSEEQYAELCQSDVVLQIPTFSPMTRDIQKRIPQPFQWENWGQYGYVESEWFHPGTNSISMGLHFLEAGILIRKTEGHTITDLQHLALKEWLFEDAKEVIDYRKKSRFFLAYLYSRAGIYVYLHALLRSLEGDTKEIDICVPDPEKLLAYFKWRMDAGLGLVEQAQGVKQIIYVDEQNRAVWNLQSEGKTVRFLCPGSLNSSDFESLLDFSENFVACRGDQSFSEAVSRHKCFFYDPRDHSRYFTKDLLALAQNRIPQFPTTVEMIRLYSRVLDHNLTLSTDDEWVDELYFTSQDLMQLSEIADKMGNCLRDPRTFSGFKKLGQIMSADHCCHSLLINTIKRAACHRQFPEMAQQEMEAIQRFVQGGPVNAVFDVNFSSEKSTL